MKRILSFLLFFSLVQSAFSQVELVVSDVTGDSGESVTVEVRINGFTDIMGMQFSLNWDPNVFTINNSSIGNVTTDIPQFDITDIGTNENPAVDPGQLIVQWNVPQGVSVPNNHLLFSFEAMIGGDPCSKTDINMTSTPRPIEFLNGSSMPVTATSNNGSLEVTCPNNEAVVVNVPSITASSGDQVCMSVKVDNFKDLVVAQFPLKYPADKLQYVSATTTLPVESLFASQTPGVLKFLWFDNAPETPETIVDGGEIINVCFNVIGASGTTAKVEVLENSEPEVEFSNDAGAIPFVLNDGEVIIQGGSTDLTLYFEDTDVIKNQNSCISVRVKNFDNVQTVQFGMDWDMSRLTYTNTGNYNTDMGIDSDGFSLINGKLRFSDFKAGGWGIIPDETILFDVCFDVAGECDDETSMNFTSDFPGGIEITDINNNVLTYFLDPGDVKVICPCVIVNKNVTDVSCNGDTNGAISFDVEGATGNFTCNWSDASINSCSPSDLAAKSYTVTITDEAGCTSTSSFVVNEPDEINLSYTKSDEQNNCDGSIDLTVSGGTGNMSFAWSNDKTTEDLDGLCKGDYVVTVTDQNNCTAVSESIKINPKPLAIDNIEVVNVLCNGASTGSIDLSVSGGCPEYTFNWEKSGGGITIPNASKISGLPAGDYNVTITDKSTPTMELIQTYTVTQNPPIVINVESVTDSDGNNGSIDVTVSGGEGSFSYLWTPGNYVTEDISGIPGGKFVLQVTDGNGCVVSSDEIIVGSTYIQVDFNDSDIYNGFGVSCNGACDGKIGGAIPVANGNVSVTVNGEAKTWPLEELCAGSHQLTFTDEKGITFDTTIVLMAPDALEGSIVDVSECSNGSDGKATVQIMGGVEDYSYKWSNNEDAETAESLAAGAITVLVTDANGCQYMLDATIQECSNGAEPGCYSGNPIMTPNGDSKNDLLVISCLKPTNNVLYVFDRLGNQVFSMKNYDNTWSGLSDDGKELMEDGYMWVLETTSETGVLNIYKGAVTILR